ncbi:MAG: DUF2004 domain-containing protein [Myxococcota bacterium]
MPGSSQDLSRRETEARTHLESVYGTPEDEFGATLFVAHHLGEIDAAYWMKHTGTSEPSARQVLRLLELRVDPEEEEDLQLRALDFTLPDDVTNYVVCVEFDDLGKIAGVSMES